jgi:hypothetical protein
MKKHFISGSASLFLYRTMLLAFSCPLVSYGLQLSNYVAYPTGSWPEAVAIADLNGDGRKDVVMSTSSYFNTNDNSILIFFQNNAGALNPPIRYAAGANAVSVAIADFNGDGKLDIAVGKKTSGIRVFWQDSTGGFTNFTDYPTPNAYHIVAGDFNNDGRMDLAGIGWDTSQVDIFTQSNNGTLFLSGTYPASYAGNNDIKAADVNGDGLTDLVIMNGQTYSVPNVSILLQTNGGFSAPIICDLGGNQLTTGVGVGDFTGNGTNDIAVTYGGNSPNSKLTVFNQAAGDAFAVGVTLDSYDVPECMEVGDLDMDGRADIVTLHGGWNAGGVYLQTSPGQLIPEQLFTLPYASSYNPQGLALGDVNGDGAPDIVIADYNNGLLVVYNATPSSPFRITQLVINANGQCVLTAPYLGLHGSCSVQRSTTPGNWTTVGAMTGTTWTDPDTTLTSSRFYRLLQQ